MVPLATSARLATSSSLVASKPRTENSSSAAARIASRRPALRALRPPRPASFPALRDGRAAAVLLRAGFLGGTVRVAAMILTDRSVIYNWKAAGAQARKSGFLKLPINQYDEWCWVAARMTDVNRPLSLSP